MSKFSMPAVIIASIILSACSTARLTLLPKSTPEITRANEAAELPQATATVKLGQSISINQVSSADDKVLNQHEHLAPVHQDLIPVRPAPWQADFLPCDLRICGGFPQNIATFTLKEGKVSVLPDRRVLISLYGLRPLNADTPASNIQLEVFFGTFGSLTFNGPSVGFIASDQSGNFDGLVKDFAGVPVIFPSNVNYSIILNLPGVRSEFIAQAPQAPEASAVGKE